MPKHLCNQFLPKTLRFSLQRHKSSRIRLSPNSGTVCRIFYGGILFWLWESKRNCAFTKAAKICFLKAGKIQGRGETNAFDAMVSLKMRCIFFTEQSYTDQGAPLDPQSLAVLLSPMELGGCVRIWLGAFGKAGLF